MTKIKLKTIVNPDFIWALSNIMKCSLPAKTSYWINKSFKKIQTAELDYQRIRIETAKKYCKINPDSNEIEFNKETKEIVFINDDMKLRFIQEITELNEQEVEIPTIDIDFDSFGDDVKIEPRILNLLEEIIK